MVTVRLLFIFLFSWLALYEVRADEIWFQCTTRQTSITVKFNAEEKSVEMYDNGMFSRRMDEVNLTDRHLSFGEHIVIKDSYYFRVFTIDRYTLEAVVSLETPFRADIDEDDGVQRAAKGPLEGTRDVGRCQFIPPQPLLERRF